MTRSLLFSCLIGLTTLMGCAGARSIRAVESKDAPKAIGPYSQAVKYGKMIYTSGQIGMSPADNTLGADIASQTHQALKNLRSVLKASGSDMEHVLKVTVFLKDLGDFARMNDIYKDYFPGIKPARSTVQAARLPKDALIEIECVAVSVK